MDRADALPHRRIQEAGSARRLDRLFAAGADSVHIIVPQRPKPTDLHLAARADALLLPYLHARRGDGHRPFAEAVFVRLVGIRVIGIRVIGIRVIGVRVIGVRVIGLRVIGVRVAGVRVAGIRVAGVRVAGVRVAGVRVAGGRVAGVRVAGVRVAGLYDAARVVVRRRFVAGGKGRTAKRQQNGQQ